jgi:hypothetical protein
MANEIPVEQVDMEAIRTISSRADIEEKLAEKLRNKGLDIKGEDIIIDIPEPVSFETGLYVMDEECSFSSSSSAFKEETVNAFIKTLYKIRIFINQKYKESLKTFTQSCSIIDL